MMCVCSCEMIDENIKKAAGHSSPATCETVLKPCA